LHYWPVASLCHCVVVPLRCCTIALCFPSAFLLNCVCCYWIVLPLRCCPLALFSRCFGAPLQCCVNGKLYGTRF
jgi:hypothetical protein